MRSLLVLTAAASVAAAAPGVAAAARAPETLRLDATAPLRHDTLVSSNWAGYVVTAADPASSAFTSVSARWVQPRATCDAGRSTYSAFWVGLGGFSDSSQALEQIGTEADCSPTGRASYSMWYELVPAPSVPLRLKVVPGDAIAASVVVRGQRVTLQIRNLSRRTSATKVLRFAAPDVSSAEWVAEAPSACTPSGRCTTLPLANFGAVTFSRASVTGAGHAGSIADAQWTAIPVQLATDAGSPLADATAATGAVPSDLSPDGTAFTISYQDAASAGT